MRQFSENFYQNEHLFYGQFGNLLLIIAFVTALFVVFLGFRAFFSNDKQDEGLVNNFFSIHMLSIAGVMLLLIYLFKGQYFEYHYIWRHSSRELPWYYILSAMWEGQEGSFLLWIFWQAVLGGVLMKSRGSYKYGVLAILSLIQVFLIMMIGGVDIFGKWIGSNPFVLLRDEMQIPITQSPNYLELIKDGNGLNILLQNYWMVIHPPVLFLGFASLSIPFGYAVSALLKRDFDDWIPEVKPWTLFGLASLGTGILMGGRWAYESLSFGGFWAWDPVENASLVPWLVLLAGVHTMVIYQATKHSLRSTFLYYILAFGFIWYSTFLTRSGILGDSSVHSFTDLGMTGQLLVFGGILLIPALLLLAYNWSKIPENQTEEKLSSREFWIFIGTMIILVSAIQITYTTSIPVWNKLFDLKLAPPVNPNGHYNSIQIWFTIFVLTLMGMTFWLQYRSTVKEKFIQSQIPIWITTLVLSIAIYWGSNFPLWQEYHLDVLSDYVLKFKFISSYLLLLLASVYVVVSTSFYIYRYLRTSKLKAWGSSLSHIGFAVLILGALLSQYQKKALSNNAQRIDFGTEFDMDEQSSNSLLTKDKTVEMMTYNATYTAKEPTKLGATYTIIFKNIKNPKDSFVLHPESKFIQEGMNRRLQAEPSIKHLWGSDVFVHISSVPQDEDRNGQKEKTIGLHDTFFTSSSQAIFQKVNVLSSKSSDQIHVEAILELDNAKTPKETIKVPYSLNSKTGKFQNPITFNRDSTIAISLQSIQPEEQKFTFQVQDFNKPMDWIILKAIEFPHIRILWIGAILMVFGILLTMWSKIKTRQTTK